MKRGNKRLEDRKKGLVKILAVGTLAVTISLGGIGCTELYNDPLIGGLTGALPEIAQPGGYKEAKRQEKIEEAYRKDLITYEEYQRLKLGLPIEKIE